MKFLLHVLLFMANIATIQAQSAHSLDPEMTGEEYRHIFAKMEQSPAFHHRITSDPLNSVLEIGKRNLDWVDLINSKRDVDHQLQLTTPDTTMAYPIEAPGKSNRSLITNHLDALRASMPSAMAQVLFSSQQLPESIPVDDAVFIQNARTMNRIYEAASRWLLEEPYLDEMRAQERLDIRGYYFLQRETNLDYKLNHWELLSDEVRNQYTEWLIGECNNTTGDSISCEQLLSQAVQNNQVLHYHQTYVANSEAVFNSFFELQNPRPEAIWVDDNPHQMIMPFTLPEQPAAQTWFKTNVEDEFHFNDWSLRIHYSHEDNLAKLVFEPGATPHVNDLGGDTITMDANRQLNDYEVAWTIRHEFAHVLGLPDCYVEFYDARHEVMINYQIDTSNLMCSRRGHLQEKHYLQLKKHYQG